MTIPRITQGQAELNDAYGAAQQRQQQYNHQYPPMATKLSVWWHSAHAPRLLTIPRAGARRAGHGKRHSGTSARREEHELPPGLKKLVIGRSSMS
jgi:hypothetical protein